MKKLGNFRLMFAMLLTAIVLMTAGLANADQSELLDAWQQMSDVYSYIGFNIDVDAAFQENGDLKISWKDPNNTEESLVFIQHLTKEEAREDRVGNQAAVSGTVALSELPLVLQGTVPGDAYLIMVFNDDGMGRTLIPAHREYFDEFKPPKLSLECKQRVSGSTSSLKSFSQKDLEKAYGTEDYGLYVQHNMPKLRYTREYATRLVLYAPDGTAAVLNYVIENYKSGGSNSDEYYWRYIPIMGMMDDLVDSTGHVLTDEYELCMFYGNKYVSSATFKVTQ